MIGYLLMTIAFVAIGAILLIVRKRLGRWMCAIALHGPSFLWGRQYLYGLPNLTDEVIHNGLAFAKQAHEMLWGKGWSYSVQGMPSGWCIEWRSPNNTVYSYIIAWDRGRHCWLVRLVRTLQDLVDGTLDVVNGVLYSMPDVMVSGVAMADGWIDITGLAYWQARGIERAGKSQH